jgi:polysaccharide biosynthesis protein PslG
LYRSLASFLALILSLVSLYAVPAAAEEPSADVDDAATIASVVTPDDVDLTAPASDIQVPDMQIPAPSDPAPQPVPPVAPDPVLPAPVPAVVAPAPAPLPPAQPRAGFKYGTILNVLKDAPLAHDAGFGVMMAYVNWAQVEPSRGQYLFEQKDRWGQPVANDLTNVINAAKANNMKLALRLDNPPGWAGSSVSRINPADLEDYLYHVAKYARGSLAYVEVFNEMNLPGEWGGSPDPAAYARVLEGAYGGAHRGDPNVIVVSAAPSQRTGGLGGTMEDVDWLEGLYAAGGNNFFDAMGMHAYLGNFDPATDPSCTPMCFRDIELYRGVMERHGDSGKAAYITEMGTLEATATDLGAYEWMETPADKRAENLVNALRMANANYPWIIGATVFNLDYAASGTLPSTSERVWFSLLNADRSPRQAYTAIKQARANSYLP